jgi:hypothetical protein
MSSWTELLSFVRIIANIAIALLCLGVVSTYANRFHFAWRMIGLYFLLTSLALVADVVGRMVIFYWIRTWLLTPTVILVVIGLVIGILQRDRFDMQKLGKDNG